MEKYKIKEQRNKIILKNMKDFNPKHIFECGQAFRWIKEEDNSYTAISKGRVVNVKREDGDVVFNDTNLEDFKNIWYHYFDLETDYGQIKRELAKDPILEEAIEFGDGLRILNQEPFETTISFIISANNQIPRIKRSIELISKHFGKQIKEDYYSFPTADKLAQVQVDELKEISRVGFRAQRIVDTSRLVAEGAIDINSIYKLSKEEGKELLMTLPGVGPKVSECILLFAYKKREAFPVDVWVKRVMEHFYLKEDRKVQDIEKEGARLFGDLAGFAQQYLFYYARELGIGRN
ncbi:MAG TPA: DNA glycosylase [Tissierellaceae bacterium]|nr:DNA glycosylase [Tissierellaceae bacterium]